MCCRYILESIEVMDSNRHLILLHQFPKLTRVMLPFFLGVHIIKKTRSYNLDVLRAQSPVPSLISNAFNFPSLPNRTEEG